MKFITVPQEFKQANGESFKESKKDAKGNPVFKLDKDGNPLARIQMVDKQNLAIIQEELVDAGYLTVLKSCLEIVRNGIMAEKQEKKELPGLSFEDSESGLQVYRSINVSNGKTFELENAPLQWLIEKLKKYGPNSIGFNVAVILEPLTTAVDAGQSRPEKRREK